MQISSPPTFDIDALLQSIPGNRPGGDPRAYARGLRAQISELRNPPRSANPDEPGGDGGIDGVDWMGITVIASEALTDTTKDLRIACHLTEAAMQHWGIAGLRDGFCLMRRMAEMFWDELAPELDPEDPDVRCSPLENLLDDPNRGPRLPTEIRGLPILDTGTQKFSLMTATRQSEGMSTGDISAAIRQVAVQDACRLSEDLDGAIAELESFQQVMIDRMAGDAPSFVHLQESLGIIRQWLDTVLKPQFESRDIIDAEEATEVQYQSPSHTAMDTDPNQIVSDSQRLRADAYRQLESVAGTLLQIEPHSPIPYMIRRAVTLGKLPFPKLMTQLVHEESTLDMFHRELGLVRGDTEASSDAD